MKKYENFCKALQNLKDIYNYEPPRWILSAKRNLCIIKCFWICRKKWKTGLKKDRLRRGRTFYVCEEVSKYV